MAKSRVRPSGTWLPMGRRIRPRLQAGTDHPETTQRPVPAGHQTHVQGLGRGSREISNPRRDPVVLPDQFAIPFTTTARGLCSAHPGAPWPKGTYRSRPTSPSTAAPTPFARWSGNDTDRRIPKAQSAELAPGRRRPVNRHSIRSGQDANEIVDARRHLESDPRRTSTDGDGHETQ
jgi:hypothetical protein